MTEWIRDHDGRIVGAWNFQKMTETEARRRFGDHPVLNNAIERKTMNDDQALRKSLEGILAMSTPRPMDGDVYRDDRLDMLMSLVASREVHAARQAASAVLKSVEDRVGWLAEHRDINSTAAIESARLAALPYLKTDKQAP